MKKKIEVMGIVNDGAKSMRRMMSFELEVNDYVHIGTAEKVREMIRKYVRETKVLNGCDPERLTFLWDDFFAAWKDVRAAEQKEKRAARAAARPTTGKERLEQLEEKRRELWEQFKADNQRLRKQIDELRMKLDRIER